MKKKEITAIRKRLTKEGCTISRVSGCYVSKDKQKMDSFSENLLAMEEEDFFRYLDLAKKVLSGKVGNNILNLPFSDYDKQRSLLALRDSELKEETILDAFYDLIIENYEPEDNFLILLFHDSYDVMSRNTGNELQDESEEVYQYIIAAICPVALSKPSLGVLAEGIRSVERNWLVGNPDTGFIFPNFVDESTDIDSVMYYTRTPKLPRPSLMQEVLGCEAMMTSEEKKVVMEEIIEESSDDETLLVNVHAELARLDEEEQELLTPDLFTEVLEEAGMEKEQAARCTERFSEELAEDLPIVAQSYEAKKVEESMVRKERMALADQLSNLQAATTQKENTVSIFCQGNIDIRMVDGQRCLVLPLQDEEILVNGKPMEDPAAAEDI